ncbi:hypothetical protein BB561_000643 [Smittium simulii]|uniref:Transcription and mRNA export factor SUS1 n=1 Tax=Smittium simulii TaxID=133385 RepID=A0A2T9YYA7_9FUNG|nr:hypothetical protein BB561_000643 [Smittium simulii]
MDTKNSFSQELKKQNNVREEVLLRFVESGEKERILELTKSKFIANGWSDHVRSHCKELIKEKDINSVTIDELCDEVMPYALSSIQEDTKIELTEQVKAFLTKCLPEITNNHV